MSFCKWQNSTVAHQQTSKIKFMKMIYIKQKWYKKTELGSSFNTMFLWVLSAWMANNLNLTELL